MRRSQLSYVIVFGTDPSNLPEDAFKALPEAYQADSCLEYWQEDSVIYARPCLLEITILGSWVMRFDPETKSWVDC